MTMDKGNPVLVYANGDALTFRNKDDTADLYITNKISFFIVMPGNYCSVKGDLGSQTITAWIEWS